MRFELFLALTLVLNQELIAAVNVDHALQQDSQHRTPIGGHRDKHGCYTAAGYVWCEKIKRCVRPWETPCSEFKE